MTDLGGQEREVIRLEGELRDVRRRLREALVEIGKLGVGALLIDSKPSQVEQDRREIEESGVGPFLRGELD